MALRSIVLQRQFADLRMQVFDIDGRRRIFLASIIEDAHHAQRVRNENGTGKTGRLRPD